MKKLTGIATVGGGLHLCIRSRPFEQPKFYYTAESKVNYPDYIPVSYARRIEQMILDTKKKRKKKKKKKIRANILTTTNTEE